MVCPVPGLREAEVGPDEHAEAGAAPNESGVTLEVPGLRVHHELLQCATDEAGDVGAVTSKADGLLSQSGGPLDLKSVKFSVTTRLEILGMTYHFGRKSPS